jgi:hypothetical protein
MPFVAEDFYQIGRLVSPEDEALLHRVRGVTGFARMS